MTDPTNEPKKQNVNANHNSIAVGSISAGGDISGKIHIGNVGYTTEQVSVLIAQIQSTFHPKPFDGRCPYKGLDVFEEEDAELFFGREKLVDDLVNRIKESRTVFVTGPSGSGKSSLVRAGLIHLLKQGKIKGSERWLYATMKPGRDPIDELGRVVSGLASSTNPEDEIRAKAMKDAAIFARWCEIVLKDGRDKRLVLFIDQFEEVFTQISKEEERVAFLNLLTHAATMENGRVSILFSMRSDFVSSCAAYPQLNVLLNQQFVQIGAMQPEELVSAIAQPALRVGLRIDPDLIAQIIDEMKGEPGVLPLMQFALKDLFDSQHAKSGVTTLTLNEYLQRGGIHKALERHADDSFSRLSKNEQELARSIFSRLIEIGHGAQDTKRTALFDELVPANTRAEDVDAVVQKLADARLITTDEVTGKETVTISHEKLIDAWPWLKKLVNENRDVIVLQNEISADAKEWDEHKRDNSYLYSGARLATAQENIQNLILSKTAQLFLKTAAQVETDALLQRDRRLRWTVIVSITAAVTFLVLGSFGWAKSNEALSQAETARANAIVASTAQANAEINQASAELQAKAAISGQLIAQSQLLATEYPQRSLLFAIESLNLVNDLPLSSSMASKQGLLDILQNTGGTSLTGALDITNLSFSPDGKWLVGTHNDVLQLWDTTKIHEEPITLVSSNSILEWKFSPNGRWLAARNGFFEICLWDLQNLSGKPVKLNSKLDSIQEMAFINTGQKLVVLFNSDLQNDAGHMVVWDINNISADSILLDTNIESIFVGSDGNWLLSKSGDNQIRLWRADDLSISYNLDTLKIGLSDIFIFSPDGKWLAAKTLDHRQVLVWEIGAPSKIPLKLKEKNDFINTMAFSPDGHWLATTSEKLTLLWDMENLTSSPTTLEQKNYVDNFRTSSHFSNDGHWLVTANDKILYLWNVKDLSTPPEILELEDSIRGLGINNIIFSPDGRWMATISDESTRLWDTLDLTKKYFLHGSDGHIESLEFSTNSQWIITNSSNYIGTISSSRLWKIDKITNYPTVINHGGDVLNLTFDPDGQQLFIFSADKTLRVVNVQDPALKPAIIGEEGAINNVAFNRNGQFIATINNDNSIFLWSKKNSFKTPALLAKSTSTISTFLFSPDGDWLFVGNEDKTNRLWNLNELPNNLPTKLDGLEEKAVNVLFSPDNRWLVINDVNKILVWNMESLDTPPLLLDDYIGDSQYLSISPDSRWLLSLSKVTLNQNDQNDQVVYLWDLKNQITTPIEIDHTDVIDTFAFSPDGTWLATGGQNHIVRLWNMKQPSDAPIELSGHNDSIRNVLFSPNGKWLVTSSSTYDNTLYIWNMNKLSYNPVILTGHQWPVWYMQFSPNGYWLATASDIYTPNGSDNTIRIWDMQDPTNTSLILRGHDRTVDILSFSPDSNWLATGSSDNTTRLWNLQFEELAKKACEAAGRNFSLDEWQQYFPQLEYRKTCQNWPMDLEFFKAIAKKALSNPNNPEQLKTALDIVEKELRKDSSIKDPSVRAFLIVREMTKEQISRDINLGEFEHAQNLLEQAMSLQFDLNFKEFTIDIVNGSILAEVEAGNIEKAVELLEQAQNSNIELDYEEIISNLKNIVVNQITSEINSGNIEQAIKLLDRANQFIPKIEDEGMLNSLCWNGSLQGFAHQVLNYCEQAVILAPDQGYIRDSRGLARALTNDYQGAILDFQYFVDELIKADENNDSQDNNATIQQRQQWIADLNTGKNPFTPELLEKLKHE